MSVSHIQNLLKCGFIKKSFNLFQSVPRRPLNAIIQQQTKFKFNDGNCKLKTSHVSEYTNSNNSRNYLIMLGTSIFTWLGFSTEVEEEDEMIMVIKRSILCIQRDELAKAEQMLHVALRMAQQKQNTLGVTYIHDIMANLALDQGQLDKAEKLFVSVMQQLLQQGTSQDDLKVFLCYIKLLLQSIKYHNCNTYNKDAAHKFKTGSHLLLTKRIR